jgi:hypothetical protein
MGATNYPNLRTVKLAAPAIRFEAYHKMNAAWASSVFHSGTCNLVYINNGEGNLELVRSNSGRGLRRLRRRQRLKLRRLDRDFRNFLVDSEAQLQASVGAFVPPPPGAGCRGGNECSLGRSAGKCCTHDQSISTWRFWAAPPLIAAIAASSLERSARSSSTILSISNGNPPFVASGPLLQMVLSKTRKKCTGRLVQENHRQREFSPP